MVAQSCSRIYRPGGETYFIFPTGAVTRDDVTRIRNKAVGLICVAYPADMAERFDLPFFHEIIDHPAVETGNL
jgi:3,4-dihydroxy 2-butanone 4-phosphate synthase